MHHADADVRLADLDIAYLLIQELFFEGLLCVRLQFGERDVIAGAHVARRLRIGWIDLGLCDNDHGHEGHETERKQHLLHCCSYTERLLCLHFEFCILPDVIASSTYPTCAGSARRSSTSPLRESARTS